MAVFEPFADVVQLDDYLTDEDVDPTGGLQALEMASDLIRGYTRQVLSLVEGDVEVHDGAGHSVLLLRELPVVEVASVTVDGEPVTDWYASEAGVLRRTDGESWPLNEKVEVTYTHGYEDLPGDIVAVTLQLAGRGVTNPSGIQREQLGQYAVTYTGGQVAGGTVGLTSGEKLVLDRYRVG